MLRKRKRSCRMWRPCRHPDCETSPRSGAGYRARPDRCSTDGWKPLHVVNTHVSPWPTRRDVSMSHLSAGLLPRPGLVSLTPLQLTGVPHTMGSLPPLSPDLMAGPQAALSAGSGDLDHLWSFDDLLWDPFYWVASPVPPSTCGGAAGGQVGRCVVPTAAAPILQPALAPPRRGGGSGGKKLGGCLVPGCTTTRELTPYERRAMLCSQHLKAERVLVDGAFLRFCQKCRRMETLSAFDGTKRSCRARLEAVRAKRAATGGLEQKSQTPPRGASVHRPARRDRGFQAQPTTGFTARGLANTAQVDVQALRSLLDGPSTGSHPGSPGSTASLPGSLDTPETSLHPTLPPPAASSPSWVLPLPECASVELKLDEHPHHALPATAEEGASRHQLLSALPFDVTGSIDDEDDGTAACQLFGAIRPGCTLLTLDACLDGGAGTPTLLRPGSSLLLDDSAAWVAQMAGSETLRHLQAARARSPAGISGAQWSHAPVAVLSTSPGETVVTHADSGGAQRWSVRVNGQYVQGVRGSRSAGEQATTLHVPPSDVDGCACVELSDDTCREAPGSVAFLLLLSTTPEVVEEVNTTVAQGLKSRDRASLDKALWAVGNALALREPHVAVATPPAQAMRLAFYGAAAAIRFGWSASLEASLELLACTYADADADVALPRSARTRASLMHEAAVRGCPDCAGQLLDARCPEATGTAVEADASGCTPLHIACAAGHGRLLARLCVDEEDMEAAALATVAFFTALDNTGSTPAQLAQRHSHIQPLVAQLRSRMARGAGALRAIAPAFAAEDASWTALQRIDEQLTLHMQDDDIDASGMALAAALVASLQQAAASEAAVRLPEQSRSLLALVALVMCMYGVCLGSRYVQGVLTDEAAERMLRDSKWCPSWSVWLRIPSAMCASPLTMPLLWTTRAVLCCATLLVALAAAYGQGRRQWRWPSLQPVRLSPLVSNVHLLLLFHIYIIDPAWLAVATYSSFGGTGLLRRPWPGAVVLWVKTGASHLASNGVYGRQPAYTVLQLARGVIPMLVRGLGSEAVPASLRWMAWARIVDRDVRCDIVNATIAILAVMHARWMQRRRMGPARLQKSN